MSALGEMKKNITSENNDSLKADRREFLATRRKRIFSLRTLVLLVLALIIIYLLLSGIDLGKTIEAMKGSNPALMLLASLVYCLSNFFKALRFKVMLSGSGVSLFRMFVISGYQNFFNQIMPARTGELTFLYYSKSMAGIKASSSLHVLLVSRMADLVVVAIFFIVSLLVFSGGHASPLLLASAVFMGLVSLFFLFRLSLAVIIGRKIFDLLVSLFRLESRSAVKKINEKIDMLMEEFSDRRMRRIMPIIALTSLLVWGALYTFSFLTIRAFNVDISYLAAIVGSTGAVLTNVLPINSFGSFGTLEAGWTGGFLFVGMSMQDAVTTGFGSHLINFFVGALIALVCFLIVTLGGKKEPLSS